MLSDRSPGPVLAAALIWGLLPAASFETTPITGACATPAISGCWSAPFSEDGDDPDTIGDFDQRPPRTADESARLATAVSAAVLTDGRVLYWNGFEATEHADDTVLNGGMPPPDANRSLTRVLDLTDYLQTGADPRSSASWSVPTPENGGLADLFCADQRHLPDGSVIAVGGTRLHALEGGTYGEGSHLLEYEGVRDVRVFESKEDTWTPRSPMHHERWYPTLITVASDEQEMLVVSGADQLLYDDDLGQVREAESYDIASDTWTQLEDAADQSLPLYPRLHLLPNGRVHYSAVGQMWSPFGIAADMAAEWNLDKFFDPESGTWEAVGPALARNNAFSVMLPLRPDAATGEYDRAEILIGGGTLGVGAGTYAATGRTTRVVWDAEAPDTVRREEAGMMNAPRWFGSAVVLPTGETVALNGADRDHLWMPGSENAVRLAEVFDPQTGTWTPLAESGRNRTYHNSAVLLRDGSILVGGHAPHAHSWGHHHGEDDAEGLEHLHPKGDTSILRDPSFEIFRPPYLYRGARPSIAGVPSEIDRGRTLKIATPDATDGTLQVVLSRLPAVTHVTDADQRTVELAITHRSDGSVEVEVPANASVLPDGPYYLFLLKDNGHGPTPSMGEIVTVRG